MDTQLKHRLTGAIILVALIVLLVPEMLSGPRAPSSDGEAQALSLPTSGTAPVAPLRSIDIDLADTAAVGPMTAPPGIAIPAREAAPASAAASAASPSAAAPADAPISAAPTTSAGAATVGPEASTPPLPPTGRFVVQAGSFAAREAAESLAQRLRRQGFDVQISAVQSGGRTLHRVRVGAATDRVAAEALLMRLRAAGHSAGVVAAE